ncbi:MAG: hypothetical protein FWB81_08065, partial [Cystobacterineae bacterium]|nr:hypothetical protein [Cystobacterineae bacterium]
MPNLAKLSLALALSLGLHAGLLGGTTWLWEKKKATPKATASAPPLPSSLVLHWVAQNPHTPS